MEEKSDTEKAGRTLQSFFSFKLRKLGFALGRKKDKKCNSWNSLKLFAQTLIVWCNVLFTLLIKLIPKKRKNEIASQRERKWEREMPKSWILFSSLHMSRKLVCLAISKIKKARNRAWHHVGSVLLMQCRESNPGQLGEKQECYLCVASIAVGPGVSSEPDLNSGPGNSSLKFYKFNHSLQRWHPFAVGSLVKGIYINGSRTQEF